MRRAVQVLLGNDRATVAEHLEENAIEGQAANGVAIATLLERELPVLRGSCSALTRRA